MLNAQHQHAMGPYAGVLMAVMLVVSVSKMLTVLDSAVRMYPVPLLLAAASTLTVRVEKCVLLVLAVVLMFAWVLAQL